MNAPICTRRIARFVILFCGLASLIIFIAAKSPVASAKAHEPIQVLFLGDTGHHRPDDRAAQITPIMAGRGIEIAYSDNIASLNSSTLARYDALLLFANYDEIPPHEAQALLDYVAGGGGFVPVHCASYCFRNNPEVVALIGGQFLRHGTGEFDTQVAEPKHPIMQGLKPFRTWDETYVHHLHNERDRTVLQTRDEQGHAEPWTWVRTHGKGRIFYTAYGHDHRTWLEPGFQALLERGIRWAANKGEVFDSVPRAQAEPVAFEYEPATVPLYVADSPGKQAKQNEMQKPLSPQKSQRRVVVPAGFTAEVFVSEPQIGKPLAMTWDHRGRLWLAESVDYPNELNPQPGQGRDRIRICEDTNGDGVADKFTTFAEGLSIPTSLLHANGGLIVHQAPHTLLLKDTNGDNVADERKILFTGWGTSDTHSGPSNLRYGLDNWIYSMVGYSGFDGTVGGEKHRFGQGMLRFRPDGSKLEFLRSTNNNSWGLGFSEEGLLFGSTANGCPSVFLAIPNRYYERVRGFASRGLESISPSNKFFPITDKVRQVDWFGGFTAAAGHALYTARTYPPHYWNRTAFVAEPTGHLVATFNLVPRGTDFAAYNGGNLFASDDEWTAPIAAEVGPDGCVWVIDWYNYIVQHNPTPHGFENGPGNAYVTSLRDKTHGRIYRVVPNTKLANLIVLDPSEPARLIQGLQSDNLLWRTHAQRMLVERGQIDVLPQLLTLLKDPTVDAIGLNTAAIHVLGVLQGLGVCDGRNDQATQALYAALAHPSAAVRRNAVRVLPPSLQSVMAIANAKLLEDRDPQVQLATLLALADFPADENVGPILVEFVSRPANLRDRWLPDAATSAAAIHCRSFLPALVRSVKTSSQPDTKLLEMVGRVSEHHARDIADSELMTDVRGVIPQLAATSAELSTAVLQGWLRGWPTQSTVRLDKAADTALPELFSAATADGKVALLELSQRWRSQALETHLATLADQLAQQAADETAPLEKRIAAARQWIDLQPHHDEPPQQLLAMISPRMTPELANALIAAAANSKSSEVGSMLVEAVAHASPAARKEIVVQLARKSDWLPALADALQSGQIAVSDLPLDQRQALVSQADKELATRFEKVFSASGGLPDANRQRVIDEVLSTVLAGGDAAKGKVHFKNECAKCHTYQGEGNKVGPDLSGMAAHPKAELLTHILDPSRSVEGNFRVYSLATADGRVLSGLLASETKTTVELLDAEAKRHVVLRDDIDELAASPKSLMPEGFEKQLGPQGLADLLAFLSQRGKFLPLDLRKVATASSAQGMFYDRNATSERLVFDDWQPKRFAGVPFQLIDPQEGRTPNVVLLYGPQGNFPPKLPKQVSLSVGGPARAIHLLGGVSGWGFPLGQTGSVSMIVRLRYADGQTEDHNLLNGEHLADYIREIDVPKSQLAFTLSGGQQVRYLAIVPGRSEPIDTIELVKGPDGTAPIVMAITVETPK